MAAGPITIFDKSALQALSMDESVWLDAFFLVNVVPLFYVETLADLEKEMAEGKSAEEFVGMLAAKTPPNAVPNVHHRALVSAELATGWQVPIDGRVPIAGGDVRRASDGQLGVHVEGFDEAVALDRWRTTSSSRSSARPPSVGAPSSPKATPTGRSGCSATSSPSGRRSPTSPR